VSGSAGATAASEDRLADEVLQREAISTEIREAVRHTAIYGIGGLLVKAVGFLMLPYYTHYLTPADYGILEILDLSITLFGMVLQMGMTSAFLRCYAAADSAEEKKRVVSTACLFVAGSGIATFLAGVGLVRPISTMLFGPQVPSIYLLLSFSSLIMTYMANLPRTYLRALEASGAYTIVDSGTAMVLLCLNVVFISIFKLGLMGILLSTFVVAIFQVVLLTGWAYRKVGIRFSSPQLRYMLSFGLPLIFANLGLFVLNFSDRFFLQRLQSLEVVGIYAVGYKFGYMMNYLLVQPFLVMWQTRMYAIHARPEHPKIFRQLFMLYTLLLTFAGLGMSVFSPEVVHLMVGAKFVASQEVIPLVVLSYIFYGIGYYAQVGMLVTDQTKSVGVISAAAAVLNLALNYVLIAHYGMMGAAWATALSFLFIAIGSYCLSQKQYPLPLGAGRIATVLLLGMALYLPTRWCNTLPVWMALWVKACIVGAFPVVIWKSGLISPDETVTLISARNLAVVTIRRVAGRASRRCVSQ
jgi:O-antigen/teichoic acid export membrane protein